jgi:hypothetical protein
LLNFLNQIFILIVFKISMYNLQKVHFVLFANRNLLTLFNKALALHCENHTKHINKSSEIMEEFQWRTEEGGLGDSNPRPHP